MLNALEAAINSQDIFISAAAVADFEMDEPITQKIKDKKLTLTLKPTVDILAKLAREYPHIFTVGFAAETENVLANAREKLVRKGVNLIVANDVSHQDIGFNSDFNEVSVLAKNGEILHLEKSAKRDIAEKLLHIIHDHFKHERRVAS